jgi:hypothetical protein
MRLRERDTVALIWILGVLAPCLLILWVGIHG